ncbi:MAG: peptidylprolyl isomerase, partial [Gemmatimonadales bacterium]
MIHGLALVASLAAVGMQTQQQFTPVDGIAAVVGANVIPMSRLTEEMNVAFQSMGGIPNDSSQIEAIRTELLDRLIDEELLVQAAIRDTSIHVAEQRLVEAVDETVRRVRESFATETEFFTELRNAGFITEQRYRQYTADRQRRDMLRQELLNKLRQSGEIRELSPTEAEMRAYYQDALGQLPPRPPSISFRQIVVRPQADSVAHETARQLALSIRQELLADGDFAALARQYSQDPTTKDDGGQLGWFRRGVMHRAFEAVAFRLRPGQISNLV